MRDVSLHNCQSIGYVMETTWIADEPVIFVHPSGRQCNGRIAIGLPFQYDEHEARCAVSLEGLEMIGIPACGSSPLQALLLGVQLLGYRLHDFLSRGGRVLAPDNTEIDLGAFFGPLLRSAG